MLVRNADQRSGAYDHLRDVYRPSHADFTYDAKYGVRAVAGGGRASARETIGRVAAGAVARRCWPRWPASRCSAGSASVHGIDAKVDASTVTLAAVEATPTRCPDPDGRGGDRGGHRGRPDATATRSAASSSAWRGGVPAGLGEPVFDKLEADLAKARDVAARVEGLRDRVGLRRRPA